MTQNILMITLHSFLLKFLKKISEMSEKDYDKLSREVNSAFRNSKRGFAKFDSEFT